VLRPLLPIARTLWATQASDNPRALAAADLGRLSTRFASSTPLRFSAAAQFGTSVAEARSGAGGEAGHVGVRVEARLENALREARAFAKREGGVVCVTGSLMVVGQARAALGLAVPELLW